MVRTNTMFRCTCTLKVDWTSCVASSLSPALWPPTACADMKTPATTSAGNNTSAPPRPIPHTQRPQAPEEAVANEIIAPFAAPSLETTVHFCPRYPE